MNETPPPADGIESAVPAAFGLALFGRTSREDLTRYAPRTLVALAESAWDHLRAPRPPGRHVLRVIEAEDDAELGGVTIFEIVNDDMPFLLDSTLAEFSDQGVELRLVAHPIFRVARDDAGNCLEVELDGGNAPRESFIHIHVARLDHERVATLAAALDRTYGDVRAAVVDWQAMRTRVADAAALYRAEAPPLPRDEVTEAVQFLDWLIEDNFIFLGLRHYRYDDIEGDGAANFGAIGDSGLGLLRDPNVKVLRRGHELVSITPEVLEFLHEPHALIITKANVKSRVHRHAHMDYIGIKQFSAAGRLEGELRLVGLFTAVAYTRSVFTIPYIRHKVVRILAAASLDPRSHSGKVLSNVLETFPRDELFQIDAGTLSAFVAEIASLYERPRLRVLTRADRFDRFVSVIAFIPRDRYDTSVRRRVGDYLARVFEGRISAVYPYYPEGPLVRTHYIVGRYEGATPRVPRETLEAEIAAIIRTWNDALGEAIATIDQDHAKAFALRYGQAFPAGYREDFDAAQALADIAIIDSLSAAEPRAVILYRPTDAPLTRADLKVFSRGRPMPLSERVPVLEQMGFRVVSERTFHIAPTDPTDEIWLHDMSLERANGGDIDIATHGAAIEATLAAVFHGECESDNFNALVLEAGLEWRDVAVLRALSRHLRQAGIAFSQSYLGQTLANNPNVARSLAALLYARFDPRRDSTPEERAMLEAHYADEIETALAAVASLDEDRILRRFRNIARAAIRTNIFQRDDAGRPRATIAFKFESRRIDELPQPRPLYEISVYAPRVEGVHLRFGKVARGGLRWSDRPQDFRTEILGLVKAQHMKNALIVPVGAKGGFVPKQLPAASDRDAWMEEGTSAYRLFVTAMLELTDNIVGDAIVPPADTIRHDGDDPYLVVAADKGTATFSDIANSIAVARDYWLGDAFASGGSAGYDHKKLGITARGAWVAVERHFREMNVDIARTPFTIVGVGDMSGDVFGNAMLLSPQTRLVAAFDHRDIFLDPDPDPAAALAERARLFALPRSSWRDYDRAILSRGGGIFPRSAKQIPLSEEARAMLGLAVESATPNDILRAILKAPVDLLFFGGIGTFVRASHESDESVHDRANDSIRVAASELACKVIGEGANLGITQLGRIEAAQRAIRLNTDSIDNSAGVNTSDVEVNLKIALAQPLRSGGLTIEDRDQLLASLAGEVAVLVLRNNYRQTLAITLAERRGWDDVDFAIGLMDGLQREGRLDRTVEFLPEDTALLGRRASGKGLTRPELAVLLSYAKLALKQDLLATDLPNDPYLAQELVRYFPAALYERFGDAVRAHRLRREIIVSGVTNAIVDLGGPIVLTRVARDTGADAAKIMRAFVLFREAFALDALIAEIDALDNRVASDRQLDLYAAVQRTLFSRVTWFVRNVDFAAGLRDIATRFAEPIATLVPALEAILPPTARDRMAHQRGEWEGVGVPAALAARLAGLGPLESAPDIVLVAELAQRSFEQVAQVYFEANEALGLGPLLAAARTIVCSDSYDRTALGQSIGAIERARRAIVANIVVSDTGDGKETVARWLAREDGRGARISAQIREMTKGSATITKLVVAEGLLSELAGTEHAN
ncbi:MAG TPA: NAD-glutamate dehydrogenase [Beijerinckiaceae bacterium]|nr:NAD-glutamate dehydrogenase [Beijerinckiaceae bacterium]